MSNFDWLVLAGTLILIVGYGTWRTRKAGASLDNYLLGGRNTRWWGVGLSIIATQASAITFLSTPGQAYADGMRFIQFYFGLPVAMVLISIVAVPIYQRLRVYTAYEYLQTRFDGRTRTLAAGLFLLQRGLSNGLSLYAPALVLSAVLGWSPAVTVCLLGTLIIAYTVSGGTRAVTITQQWQVAVIFSGMAAAGYLLVRYLPPQIGFTDALHVAGRLGKLNLVDFSFSWTDRYNFWTGMTGGLFLALSYFGTDQSQVQRYLSGQSVTQSRLGLLMNGLVKVPMQFGILLIGVLLFVFYLFQPAPLTFNRPVYEEVMRGPAAAEARQLEQQHRTLQLAQQAATTSLAAAQRAQNPVAEAAAQQRLQTTQAARAGIQRQWLALIKRTNPTADDKAIEAKGKDTDYVFISFVLKYLPRGLVGLLVAVVLSAAMSSAAGGLNSLGSTSVVDIYRPALKGRIRSEEQLVKTSRWLTVGWGVLGIGFALFAARMENLIQAVNILGSLFYGTILGIFAVAFFQKHVHGRAVFGAAVVTQVLTLLAFWLTDIAYLWYNILGCFAVMGIAEVWQRTGPPDSRSEREGEPTDYPLVEARS
ncbi:sodium:solute symporter [Hymenobacter busanensis]|uniref:Sodium:solute symporter n=1 Tax=Hymenobacter busanensis TaxID=2607656 RepID=A0A7L4ZVK9_9BACT|nr:sodium:solute symporter [Hymenobacter busanensis]KAA9332424.1 sodium:solute symporter [Hymenobacter busanensis]QHJ07238.1 sodium:solute symporter [Hymenobacter busanensis]